MPTTPQLPASVSAAWGLKEGTARRRPLGLSLERIVGAGIRVATSEGLAALSMNRVARELGAAPMSLYRHLTAKDELLAHMVDAVFAEVPPAPEPGQSWRSGLARLGLGTSRGAAPPPVAGPHPDRRPSADAEPGALVRARRRLPARYAVAEAEKPSTLLLVNGFVRNQATLEADLMIAARASGTSPEAVGAGYGALLARLTDADRFPAIHALLAARVFSSDGAIEDDFQFGLDRILDGIDVLVRARAADAAAPG